ncbi:uncharacterized protein [Drosophila takahashii]|uniref:uncharacterized protein n=1 Tax=Drosophila takahashii TaxID=29030 RepID=UPI001CF89047|nr:uncharacterized protein LOC123003420 [Drosophila takahashii]
MYRSYYHFWALFVWLSLPVGESRKQIVFNSIECSLKNNVFSKIDCHLYSRLALNVFFKINEQKAADKMVGVCEVDLFTQGKIKVTRIKNLRLDFCQLKKHTETRSMLGVHYLALRRSVGNFPDKCPFQKNTSYSVNRLYIDWKEVPQYLPETNYTFRGKIYANRQLGLEVKLTGGLYEIANYSVYKKPLLCKLVI